MSEDPRVENLARAMCAALDIDPDAQYAHGPEPNENGVTHDVLLYSPNWQKFAWRAQMWIYEQSGGNLP